MRSQFALYKGQDWETGFLGFVAEPHFFCVLEVGDGLMGDAGRAALDALKTHLHHLPHLNLAKLDEVVDTWMREVNLPVDADISLGVEREGIVYLKTTGRGVIFLKRGAQFAAIIQGNTNASGYYQPNDTMVFTTSRLSEDLGDKDLFKNALHFPAVNLAADFISNKIDPQQSGGIALFVQWHEAPAVNAHLTHPQTVAAEAPVQAHPSSTQWKPSIWKRMFSLMPKKDESGEPGSRRRPFIIALAVIIFAVLIWSVVLGYGRRREAEAQKKVESTKEVVQLKLQQANDVAFINLPRATILITEAKQELTKLKQELGDQKVSGVSEIEAMISDSENKIVKKEDKQAEEFFDLTIDAKDAKGDKLYEAGDVLGILDRDRGVFYQLNIPKKSLDKDSSSELKSATAIGIDNGNEYAYVPNGGFFQSSGKGFKKVISADPDWKGITDFALYNGNIYALDSGASDIYKYTGAEAGFGPKSSYFKGGGSALSSATGIAIDSSVYVSLPDQVLKFTAGAQDDFKSAFPEATGGFARVLTNKDIEKVYVWDKEKGIVYILAKTGEYERQVKSSALAKASDVAYYDNALYLVNGQKIFKISVE